MTTKDWTDKSPKHFRFNIGRNFITRIESKLSDLDWSHSEFAKSLGVTKGRVSRVFKNPGNLTLDTVIRWCRALDMKPAIVVYEDSATPHRLAPIHPDVFVKCWMERGCPVDMWAFDDSDEYNNVEYGDMLQSHEHPKSLAA